MKIPIEVSARHVHLSKGDLEELFGKGYELKKMKDLTQPGEFAAQECVDIEAGARKISNVRIIGPARSKTQIELAKTDAITLGIAVPVRKSGDIKGTPGIMISGPAGKIQLEKGVINTWRHIHCSPKEAKKLGLKNGMKVSVKTSGKTAVTFHNVLVKIGENYRLCMHLDTDEGNAAGIVRAGFGEILGY